MSDLMMAVLIDMGGDNDRRVRDMVWSTTSESNITERSRGSEEAVPSVRDLREAQWRRVLYPNCRRPCKRNHV